MTNAETGLAARLLAAQAIARAAGEMAQRMLADPASLAVEFKGPQDFVTAADHAAEKLIAERLAAAFPSDGFLGEESSGGSAELATDLWVVDPIDGTANFAAGRPDWCVSLGFMRAGQPEIGVIYQPALDKLFAAQRGKGATRDGRPIRVSSRPLSASTIGLDYAAITPAAVHAGHIRAVLEAGGEYRRNGSAAVSLAQVADGRLDGFVEMQLNAWDVLAGIVLVQEAGGWCSDFLANDGLRKGNPFVAVTPTLQNELIELLGLQALAGS